MTSKSKSHTSLKDTFDDYMKRAAASEGFDVNSVGKHLSGGIVELDLTKKSGGDYDFTDITKIAIKHYNDHNNSNLELDTLVKCNGQTVSGFMYYITFTARSPTHDRPILYETKVWRRRFARFEVKLFRLAQTPVVGKRSRRRKPITEMEATPGPSSMHKKKTGEKEAKPLSLPKGAFFNFMGNLRKVPELANIGKSNVTRLGSIKWKSMSAEDKAEYYYHTRSLKYEDIAGFISKVVSAHGE